ncbi:hypothetical protein Ade02nite_96690 [Paractinoplanes deccanensis]|uniref:Uncharacterized protein n=1 Tax=Paractinoplanes deccanensis TaxID=113561 RepID=A0ABQ3YLZ1_9ACTN|nr:hypothetical protein Ade02nite_96690 [Actinoplanes deccanensis]
MQQVTGCEQELPIVVDEQAAQGHPIKGASRGPAAHSCQPVGQPCATGCAPRPPEEEEPAPGCEKTHHDAI